MHVSLQDIYVKNLGLVALKGISEPQQVHLILPDDLSERSWDDVSKKEVTLHISRQSRPRRPSTAILRCVTPKGGDYM